jgi:hypothetical protein
MPRAVDMRRGFNSAQGKGSKLGTPVMRGYGSSHGTPVFDIYIDRSPRPAHPFSIISPTRSDVSDDDITPSTSPVKYAPPPLYRINLDAPVAPPVHEIPLIPIPTPKLLSQQRPFGAKSERKLSIAVPYDVRRAVTTHFGRNATVRRILTYAILAGASFLLVHSLASAFSSHPTPAAGHEDIGRNIRTERARAKTLLYRDPTRHAAVGEDVAPIHFAGADAHAGRHAGPAMVEVGGGGEEARSWRDLPGRRSREKPLGRWPPPSPFVPRVAGTKLAPPIARDAPVQADPRSWSAASAAELVHRRYRPAVNVRPAAGDATTQRLAGGLAYPGLIEARRAAAEAYRAAIGKRGATEAAKRAAKRVLAAAVVAEGDPIQGALTRPGSVIAPAAVEAMRRSAPTHVEVGVAEETGTLFEGLAAVDSEPVLQSAGDLLDTPEAEARVEAMEAARDQRQRAKLSVGDSRRMAREKLPLRLARFKEERFARVQ